MEPYGGHLGLRDITWGLRDVFREVKAVTWILKEVNGLREVTWGI